ncbi:type II secretion system protein N [Arenimonas aestuarii]
MKPWAWLAMGTCLYVVSLMVFAPARLLDAKLDQASKGHLRLASPEGTLWSGSGVAELHDQAGGRRWAAAVAWRMRPAALLAGRLDFELATDTPASLSAMSLSRSKIGLYGVDIRMPAATLAAAIPDMAAWGVAGEIRLVTDSLEFGPGLAAGSVTVHWRAAGSSLSPVSPLGDYALDVQGLDQGWRASLRTTAGPLQVSGQGAWQSGADPRFEATAVVPPALRTQLAPFLRLLAVERSDGRFDWRLQ